MKKWKIKKFFLISSIIDVYLFMVSFSKFLCIYAVMLCVLRQCYE